jgi:hypothetical protein
MFRPTSSSHALGKRPQAVEFAPGQQLSSLASSLAHLGAPLAERVLLHFTLEDQGALVGRMILQVALLIHGLQPAGV